MKKLLLLAFAICSCLNIFSQATSLTIDCQTPGWLSSMINFGDQKTVKHLTVTGYLNGSDLQFIANLNINRSLKVVDMENASFVQLAGEDDRYSRYFLRGGYFQKLIMPRSVKSIQHYYSSDPINGDSLIWTSSNIKQIDVESDLGKFIYTYIPEGVEELEIPDNIHITFPNSIKYASCSTGNNDLVIYSFIDNPEAVSAKHESYNSVDGRQYWSSISNSTFYIPKGTLEKYKKSEFATMRKYVNGNSYGTENGNVFIEYYDIDKTEVIPSMTLYKGETSNLQVKVYPDANLVSWIDYSSNNSDIVSVDSEGNVVAKDYGQAVISATPHIFIDGLETKTGTCVVTVIAHTEGIDMPTSMNIHIGEEKSLNAKTLPLDASDDNIKFESSDVSIARVTEEGVVIGIKRGTCTITATSVDGGFTATCEATVTQPVDALTLGKHELNLKVGTSDILYAQIAPATADEKSIIWNSSDEQIAIVDANGNVFAKKAGEVWIKAVSQDNEEAKDSCKVIVIQPVTGITLNHNSYQLDEIGESFELIATILPNDASNKQIKWKSSDESVCTVSNGQIIAIGIGTCVIIATSEDGGYMATCTVTVNGTGIINKYWLTYTIDGANYQSYEIEYGATITPEAEPTKEGYTFSGWSYIPATMPDHDVTVNGTFTINTYKLTYVIDGEVYMSCDVEYNSAISTMAYPTKFGYSFSGWSDVPAYMPAHDVTVTGHFEQHFDVGNVASVTDFILKGEYDADALAMYDLNGDGELNIGDLILIVKKVLKNSAQYAASRTDTECLTADLAQYTAAQFVVNVPQDVREQDIRLAKGIAQTHQMMCQQIEPGRYAVVVYSLTNSSLKAGEHGFIEVRTEKSVPEGLTIEGLVLAKRTGETARVGKLPVATAIADVECDETHGAVYDLKGRKQGAVSQKGVYIENGKKIVVR